MANYLLLDVAAILFLQLIICTMTVIEGGHPLPARRKVAVEGGVYCHDCAPDPNNNNQLILIESSGIAAAVLKLQCNNTRKMWEEEITTDHKGELVLKTDRVTSWGAHKCQLFFVSSPRLNCSSTVFPFEETYGHPLIPVATTAPSSPFQFYRTLPFVFYPHSYSCV